VELKSTAKPKSMKKQALHLYLEGLGFRSIGRLLGVSNVSVLNRIKSFGKEELYESDASLTGYLYLLKTPNS
jgi:transposase